MLGFGFEAWFFFGTVFLILALGPALVFLDNQKSLEVEEVKKACSSIQGTSSLEPNHSLIESHKIMISTISGMYKDKKPNAAKLLKRIRKRLPNEREVWKYHRMRNKVAHQLDFKISKQDAESARKNFKAALMKLQEA